MLAQAFGDGFQIDLGLAGAGDAFQQMDLECLGRHRLAQGERGGFLIAGQGWAGIIRVWRHKGQVGRDRFHDQHPEIRHAAHHGAADLGRPREFCRGARFGADQNVQHGLPRGVMRTPSGIGAERRQPLVGPVGGRATRNAIAITSPGGDRV